MHGILEEIEKRKTVGQGGWNVWIGTNEDSSVVVVPLRKFQGTDVQKDYILYTRKLY